MGSYHVAVNGGIEIKPGPGVLSQPGTGDHPRQDGQVDSISGNGGELEAYELEPRNDHLALRRRTSARSAKS